MLFRFIDMKVGWRQNVAWCPAASNDFSISLFELVFVLHNISL